jgi:hypothetical protein
LRRRLAFALILSGGLTVGASAQDIGEILGKVAPGAPVPDGSVTVLGWFEKSQGHHELVISLEPKGDAKLVADPGIVVEPHRGAGVEWLGHGPFERVIPGGSYFEGPQEIRVPFRSNGTGEVSARVEYAYCLVAYQCLFGETVVQLPAPGRLGTSG